MITFYMIYQGVLGIFRSFPDIPWNFQVWTQFPDFPVFQGTVGTLFIQKLKNWISLEFFGNFLLEKNGKKFPTTIFQGFIDKSRLFKTLKVPKKVKAIQGLFESFKLCWQPCKNFLFMFFQNKNSINNFGKKFVILEKIFWLNSYVYLYDQNEGLQNLFNVYSPINCFFLSSANAKDSGQTQKCRNSAPAWWENSNHNLFQISRIFYDSIVF